MKKFKDLNIENTVHLVGDKISIEKILNREIIVHCFKIVDSKFSKNKSGKCLNLQIEIAGIKHVVFTGSDVLIDQIKQVPEADFPFTATIVKTMKYFEFT